ncbi:MAG: hypothetical protein A2516_02840 [Alphaproteobacteria bacterium RIFOXYD12_FULL_60_8]|nr:MAG: hypothetical protein A2516_02840 [Alphaproteobacteria bacterium RIFOXYD12_FULL_60_8]
MFRLVGLAVALFLAAPEAWAADPASSPNLGLSTNKDYYDWSQFKNMPEPKRACFLRFLKPDELAEIEKGEKPWEIRLAQKAKQLNKFCANAR